MSEESLTRQTSSGIMWMTAQKWVTRIGALVTMVILTRNLAPEDFGLAAAATTLMPVLYVLADVGFSAYIIQSESAEKPTLDTAFWFSLGAGLVLAGGVALAAPLIGSLLGQPDVAPLIQVMALSVALVALGSVPVSLMRRRMAFRPLALMEVASSLVAQVVAITAALLGAGAWALVLQILVSQVIATGWVWVAARWRPGLSFSRSEFKEMAGFGINVLGSEAVMVVRYWAETAIVVAGVGVRGMGLLNIAQRLVQTAEDLSVAALAPVSMVAFSRVRDDPERLRSSYLRASSISYAVVTPMMVFVAVSAPVLIPFLFGADKTDSAVLVPAVAAWALIGIGWAIDRGLHIGIGKPRRWFMLIAVAYGLTIGILAFAVRYGLMVLVVVWVGAALIEALIRWLAVSRLIGASVWQVATPFLGIVFPGAVAVGAGVGMMNLVQGWPDLLVLAVTGVAVVATYLLTLRLVRKRVFADAVTMLPARISRLLRWALPKEYRTVNEAA
ncbi:MAG: lipopolysaccharide biosynthesis protein [Propionicimonas sp.]|nr:lipopolysaccharide biosynthesis protein [Propionicimonas sp.]